MIGIAIFIILAILALIGVAPIVFIAEMVLKAVSVVVWYALSRFYMIFIWGIVIYVAINLIAAL